MDLKPLKSQYARILFLIFLKSSEVEHLTTLDIQDKLGNNYRNLHKKEINAWLNGLQIAGLITKEFERGKPTTIDYDGRYTYDLWRLTEKGREIAKKLEIFLPKKTSPFDYENAKNGVHKEVKESIFSIDHSETNWNIVSLLRAIPDSGSTLGFDKLRDRVLSLELLMETTKESKNNGFLEYSIVDKMRFTDRILGYLGIPRKRKYVFSITEKGHKLLLDARINE